MSSFTIPTLTCVEELADVTARLSAAQKLYATFNQEQLDAVVTAAAENFMIHAQRLADMAAEETRMGRPEHKVIKNTFAVDYVAEWYKDTKTVGVVETDDVNGVDIIASPMGIIAGIIPTTNPTSTAGFKVLLALKTGNGIVIAPHPRAKKCTTEAVRVLMEGAVKGGCPPELAACITEPSVPLSAALMKSESISIVLATGGPGMVKAAYESGHPAVGVGPGNVPVVVDEEANLLECATNVINSKNFDYGVICSSEQVVIALDSIYDRLKAEFQAQNAYFLNEEEKEKVRNVLFIDGRLSADVVGQAPTKIAEMAGVKCPANTTLLVGETDVIAHSEPFTCEKLSPVLGMYRAKTFPEALVCAQKVLSLGGEGHTACLYTNQFTRRDRVIQFGNAVNVTRALINQPTAIGGIGGLGNFGIAPSMTLGCGSFGGNYVSENVGPKHILNYKRVIRCASDSAQCISPIESLAPDRECARIAMQVLCKGLEHIARETTPRVAVKQIVKDCAAFLTYRGTPDKCPAGSDCTLPKLRENVKTVNAKSLLCSSGTPINEIAHMSRMCNIPEGNLHAIVFKTVLEQSGDTIDVSRCAGVIDGVEGTIDSLSKFVLTTAEANNFPKLSKGSAARIATWSVPTIVSTLIK